MTTVQRALILSLVVGSLAACSGMSEQDQRTLSGGAIGAGVGAVGTAIIGGPVLLGTAVGAVGGAAIGAATTPNH